MIVTLWIGIKDLVQGKKKITSSWKGHQYFQKIFENCYNILTFKGIRGKSVKEPVEKPSSHTGVPAGILVPPLPIHMPAKVYLGKQWIMARFLDPSHTHCRSAWSSGLLASGWPSPGSYRCLKSKPEQKILTLMKISASFLSILPFTLPLPFK